MSFSLIYLLRQLVYRIFAFFYNWYVASFFAFSDFFTKVFERIDQTWALKVTILHWFMPLYQDTSVVGYVLGFIFRTIRIMIGSVFYVAVLAVSIALYLLFAAVPVAILLYGFSVI